MSLCCAHDSIPSKGFLVSSHCSEKTGRLEKNDMYYRLHASGISFGFSGAAKSRSDALSFSPFRLKRLTKMRLSSILFSMPTCKGVIAVLTG